MAVLQSVAISAVEVLLKTVPASLNIDIGILAKTPRRLETNAQLHCVKIIIAVTRDTTTEERNYIPYAGWIVTAKQVAEVKHYLLVQCPIVKLRGWVLWTYLLGIPSLQFGTETDTRSKPLTESNCATPRGTVASKETIVVTTIKATAMLLVRNPRIEITTDLNEPVTPERVCSYAVLQYRV